MVSYKYSFLLLPIWLIILTFAQRAEPGILDCYIENLERPAPFASFRLESTVPPEWLLAIQAAAQEWNEAGSAFSFIIDPDPTSVNSISLTSIESCGSAKRALACTMNEVQDGVIVSTKMEFNSDYSWSISGEPTLYDVQSVTTHEFGHWLRLLVSSTPFLVMELEEFLLPLSEHRWRHF